MGQRTNDLILVAIRIAVWALDTRIAFRIRHNWETWPDGWTGIATLVIRALAEVCTVSVLLVKISKYFLSNITYSALTNNHSIIK